MKLKRTFKTLLMIIATVMSVVSGILIDSGTLAYAATTYTLTLNWDDGVEWVATDKDGIYRWEKGGSKTFQAGSKAYTYVKLKNDATVKSFFSRQENKDWTDYTYTSGSLCYDTWTMYNNRNVDIYTSVSSSADVSYDWDNLVTSSKHYHSSNGNEASWSNLRDDLGRSPAPIYSIYYKLQENRYRETCYGDNQEDKDFGGYEIMLRTEDSHNSYWYGQSSYANGDRFDDWYRDEFEGIKLSNLVIVPVQIKGDKFLQINISIKNTNSYAKEISLATCSDIQVADDDNAATSFNGNGFTMTNMYCETSDNYPFGTVPTATLNVYAKDVPGYVTDADAVYIGHFVYRKEHIWLNNVLGDKTTNYNKYTHGGTSGEGELDSGFSIAWKNRTIAAGQTQTYSYIIGIGKYNSDNKITFDANGGKLKTPGENINKPNGNNSNNVTVTYGTASYSSMSGDIPERAGYTFDGWWTTPNDSSAGVMVYDASGKCNNDCNYWKNNQWQGTNDLTVYAHWKAVDVGYTVNHYVMDANGNYPSTPTKTERLSGFIDTSVTPNRLSLGDGFTYPDAQTVKVKVDGTTVVNYYYTRNKYILDLNGLISSVPRPNLTEEVDGQIFIAGKATVTVNGKVLAANETDFYQMVYYGSSYKISTVPEAGYSIIGNTTVEGAMPASDKTVTITINTNKDTKYIVRHWKEKLYLDGTKTYADSSKHNTTNYFLADTDNLTGQTNRLVTPTVKTYEGFTSPSAITVRVKGDGSLIVDYYYTRNTYTLKTDDNDSNKDDQDNGIKSGNGIDSSKTNVISEGNNKKNNKKKFKYEEVVTVTTDTLSGYHWHINDDCETIKRNLYPTGWSDHEGYRVEKWYTENGKTYGYKDQTTKFYMPAHDVKLDVNATNNSYKIIFEKNKPMNVTNPYTGAVNSASNEITGTVADTFYIYNHANQKLPGNVYNLTGWTFKGWSLKKDYSSGYGFGWEYGTNSWNNDLSHLTTKNLDVIHMYAKWEANRYQITFNYEHNSSNPYGNLGYDKKAEAATKLTKNGADSKTATYDAKVGSLPNPTLTGATFVKWVDSKGNEYTEDTIYKITSPITLYAVWQQNTGTFAYIANGITYNNNGIGVYEATNSDGTNQFKAMTEDITLEENKFGTTMENTSYSNFTKKSKYGYVVINAGTSYAKETDTSGDSVYYSFQGWSANNYATVAGDKNAGLIHQIGYKNRLFNYAYETMANEMNTLETGYNSKDTSVADSIRAKANELYNTKELTQNNTYAIMYAVWDQFPVIKSDQVVLTINDFSAYVNENADGFEQHAYDVIKDRIINANTVKDREDGNIRDNIEIENLDEILNMMLTMYKTPGMTSSIITIRTHVSDSVGNTTYGYTTVALINNKAKQDDPIIPTVDEDGKEINTRILSAKVRSITREFYNTGYEGSSDYKSDYSAATYKNYGGLIPNSIWYKNEEYVKTINQCFDNFDNNTPEQTWYFTHDNVLSIQEYAKQHKDTPHGVEDGELTNFYNKYKSCIIQGIDAS